MSPSPRANTAILLIPHKNGLRVKNITMQFVYPESTKEFTRTHSGMPVHSRIELEFRNVGF